jgi:hypothetical protein
MLISNFHIQLRLDVVDACVVHQSACVDFVAVFLVVHRKLHFFLLFVGVGLGEALLVDLGDEGVTFACVGGKLTLELSLLLVHVSLILERVFVQDLVLLLARCQPLLVPLVVLELVQDIIFSVLGAHLAVLHFDLIYLTLLDESLVLVVPDLSFLAGL